MARKKIREYDSKRLLKAHIQRLAGLQLPLNAAQVRLDTNFQELHEVDAESFQDGLAVKYASYENCYSMVLPLIYL